MRRLQRRCRFASFAASPRQKALPNESRLFAGVRIPQSRRATLGVAQMMQASLASCSCSSASNAGRVAEEIR